MYKAVPDERDKTASFDRLFMPFRLQKLFVAKQNNLIQAKKYFYIQPLCCITYYYGKKY